MFNRKSIYALNKKDPNALVYTDADGNLIRLTRDDFASEEEFLCWKKVSDADYHGEEKADHLYYPDVVEVDDLRKMLGGISKKLAYRLLAEQEIRSVRVGRSYKIPKVCIIEYLMGEEMCQIKIS